MKEEKLKKLSPVAIPGLFFVIDNDKVPYNQLAEPLMQAIEKHTGVTIEEFKSDNRKRELVEARQYFHLAMHNYSDASWQKIADYFNQGHATAMHGANTMSDLIGTQKTTDTTYKKILAEIFTIRSIKAGRNIKIKDVQVKRTPTMHKYLSHLGIEVPDLTVPIKRHAGFYDKGVAKR